MQKTRSLVATDSSLETVTERQGRCGQWKMLPAGNKPEPIAGLSKGVARFNGGTDARATTQG
jgi:hypothetical protein